MFRSVRDSVPKKLKLQTLEKLLALESGSFLEAGIVRKEGWLSLYQGVGHLEDSAGQLTRDDQYWLCSNTKVNPRGSKGRGLI